MFETKDQIDIHLRRYAAMNAIECMGLPSELHAYAKEHVKYFMNEREGDMFFAGINLDSPEHSFPVYVYGREDAGGVVLGFQVPEVRKDQRNELKSEYAKRFIKANGIECKKLVELLIVYSEHEYERIEIEELLDIITPDYLVRVIFALYVGLRRTTSERGRGMIRSKRCMLCICVSHYGLHGNLLLNCVGSGYFSVTKLSKSTV